MHNKTLNFCTLFDSNYFTRGLAMYQSLARSLDAFHLFIFAFDNKCYKTLKNLNLKNVTVISLKEFEDKELLGIKDSRSKAEYCWTCTPSTILYCLKNFPIASCTYLDADLYFFSNPAPLIEEMQDKSVSIISHRYTTRYDQSLISGKYCVQFMTFKNNDDGLEVVKWWRDRCVEWCFSKPVDGKFGDQKYLDDWTTRFNCVHEIENLGGGVAPWNVEQYNFFKENNETFGIERNSDQVPAEKFKVIFYHFHGFKIIDDSRIKMTDGYKILNDAREIIYRPYSYNLLKNEIEFLSKTFQTKSCFKFLHKIYLDLCGHKKNNLIKISNIL